MLARWHDLAKVENARMKAHGRDDPDPKDYSRASNRIRRRRGCVAELYAAGATYPKIAAELSVSISTVRQDLEALAAEGRVQRRQRRSGA